MAVLAPNTGFGTTMTFTNFDANITAINGVSFEMVVPEITHLASTAGWAEFLGDTATTATVLKKSMSPITIETVHSPTALSILGTKDTLTITLPKYGAQTTAGNFAVSAVCMSRTITSLDVSGEAVRETFVFQPTGVPVYTPGS